MWEGILIAVFMLLWFVASQVMPIIYSFSNAFSFAEITRPIWLGILGAVIFIIAIWLLWRAHHDLEKNWSSIVQKKSKQALVTQGIITLFAIPSITPIFCGELPRL